MLSLVRPIYSARPFETFKRHKGKIHIELFAFKSCVISPCVAPSSMADALGETPIKSVLLIDHKWCLRILRHGKTWELRNKNCQKRGRIGIASTAKSSPTGQTLLLGEVCLVGSRKVAQRKGSFLVPPDCAPRDFLFLRENIHKHQLGCVKDFPVLKTYRQVFAWELESPHEYDKPRVLKPKRGVVVCASLP